MNEKLYLDGFSYHCNGLKKITKNFIKKHLIFQQDNAAIQVAKIGKHYFAQKRIKILDIPAKCSKLNIIEKIFWGHH